MPYNTPVNSAPLYPNEMNKLEHDDADLPKAKRVLVYGWDGLNKKRLATDTDGNVITAPVNSIVDAKYDSVDVTYPTTSSEVYVFKNGVATVATVTVTYTDATKEYLTSIVRT